MAHLHRKGKIRWGSVAALATTIVGVVTDPDVAAAAKTVGIAIPALGTVSHLLILAGAISQAVTKPVKRKESERATVAD